MFMTWKTQYCNDVKPPRTDQQNKYYTNRNPDHYFCVNWQVDSDTYMNVWKANKNQNKFERLTLLGIKSYPQSLTSWVQG